MEDLVFLCKVAEQAQVYDEMISQLEELMDLHVKYDHDFNADERNLISVGYKNWIGNLQNGCRVL